MTETDERRSTKAMLSAVTSVLNEADGIEELVRRTIAALEASGHPHEMIVVNDGSTDDTLAKLLVLSETYPALRVVDLFRNFGVMAAVTAGVAQAEGEAVIVLDGDLQDPPELIGEMAEKWRGGADIVICRRTSRKEAFPLSVLIKIYYAIYGKLNNHAKGESVGNFGLMDRRVAEIMTALPERERYFAGLRDWVGGQRDAVEYDREARKFGTSRQGLMNLFRHARAGVVSFSVRPLRLVSALSMFVAFAMFVIGAIAILVRLITDLAVPGWATYVTLFAALGFLQSLAFAVLAEYIAVLFIEIKGRPIFYIRDEYRSGKPVPEKSSRS